MAVVYAAIGSNIEPDKHLKLTVEKLSPPFGQLILSPVYESEPVGFSGDNFLNMVVGFASDSDVDTVARKLDEIESEILGLEKRQRFAPRVIDIDLLLYDGFSGEVQGEVLPHRDILSYAFVLRPLADIASDLEHPTERKCYADLWRSFSGGPLLRDYHLSWA